MQDLVFKGLFRPIGVDIKLMFAYNNALLYSEDQEWK